MTASTIASPKSSAVRAVWSGEGRTGKCCEDDEEALMAGCEGEPRELVSLRAVERSVDPGVSIEGIWKVGPPRADDEAAVVAAGALILSSGAS